MLDVWKRGSICWFRFVGPKLAGLIGLMLLGGGVSMANCTGEYPEHIRSWSIQLQAIDIARIAASSDDLIVVDYSADGSASRAFTPGQVQTMRCRAGGAPRLLLAYLSLGEAEDYRFYWKRTWAQRPPDWLGEENPRWPGNFRVKFWDSQWQDIVFGTPESYLDAIINAGFDGVLLDTVDTYEYWQKIRPAAAREMAEFVSRLSTYARGKAGCFAVFAQNGEGLWDEAAFRRAVTGLSKEDLFYGVEHDGSPNPPKVVAAGLRQLDRAVADGSLVLALEYGSGKATTAALTQSFEEHGLIGSIGERRLKTLTRSVPASAPATTTLDRSRFCAS